MAIEIKPGAYDFIAEVFADGAPIGRIITRGNVYFPEPHSTEWAQDDLYFETRAEAVSFLVGADWAFRSAEG